MAFAEVFDRGRDRITRVAAIQLDAQVGRIDDPEIDRLLEEGRVSSDQAERTKIYEVLKRQFAKEVHNVWLTWTKWGVISAPTVHGVMGPPVDGNPPFPGLATGQPVSGLWIEQG